MVRRSSAIPVGHRNRLLVPFVLISHYRQGPVESGMRLHQKRGCQSVNVNTGPIDTLLYGTK
ncbi:uncharacterized protein BT62DRAFT_499141 [Guyanagaster necrorhizus]|uniref:Uncharacterized protein n=1 Tax=Guyanagaster necrorhizus TaxID=856835 RepID=A0A9P7W0A2_9AGAR|nr:uncharacterized protein BT62DRAFT_499141 [Guyanagaster necrorhizus MCA 3950]KAG7450242.1 hypothetical protein BT62DRAFT_499141 [Guyanagaster necrorhizus MCA 3950]